MVSILKPHILRPPPAPRVAHVWCTFPQDVDASLLETYKKLLCPEEQANLSRATTQVIRKERILAHALVCTTLARYASGNVEPSSLRFKKNRYGKPQVMWPKLNMNGELWKPPPLSFNLSHTGSLLACGVTLDSEVGIDVEEKNRQPKSNIMRLARRRFTPKEADWLQLFSDFEEQRQQFIQLWTLKEAFVKALGLGISGMPFKDFSFDLEVSPIAREVLGKVLQLPTHPQAKSISLDIIKMVSQPKRPADTWKFVLFQPSPTHVATICVEDCQQDHATASHYAVQAWQTVPLVSDQYLPEGSLGLGVSVESKLHTQHP